MPPKWTRLEGRLIFTLIAVVFLVSASVEAQTGRVALQGKISETVALSVPPNFTQGNVDAVVVSSGNTVRITLTSSDSKAQVIRVPLLVRSNSGFKISVESQTILLTQLSITDVRATGTLVSPAAISGLNVPPQFDLRGSGEDPSAMVSSSLDASRDLLLVSGPRVSLGGTLDSPNNALQVIVVIRLRPQPARGQLVHLTFAATAAPLTQ
jgi:hypothetical protein